MLEIEDILSQNRKRHPKKTLEILGEYKKRFGVSRVTDTTLLDVIGFPVYAAIRPNAQKGSLCVSSGKGVSKEAAEVGALMEAYELQAAQYDINRDRVNTIKTEQLCDSTHITDFCVKANELKEINELKNYTIDCTECIEINSQEKQLVPAELIFIPYRHSEKSHSLFFATSNGLAGGNDSDEAITHAILEVMERDVLSFSNISETQNKVKSIDLIFYQKITKHIQSLGLKLEVRCCDNEFNFPMFIAYLCDPEFINGVTIARGQGLHWDKNIALTRAITEAIQSRLTNIHGGRDDIVERLHRFSNRDEEYQAVNIIYKRLCAHASVNWSDISNFKIEDNRPKAKQLASYLYKNGFDKIYQYDLTPDIDFFKIHKVVIPKMEYYSASFPRIGPRILKRFTK
jgi:ribosomal protein S12 methylthiotransferase accessory factor